MKPYWLEILLVVITTGLAATFWSDVKVFFHWITHRKSRDRFLRYFDDVVSIQEILNQLIEDGAQRVVLLRAHNGGDLPTVGKDLYCSTAFYAIDHDAYPHGIAKYSRYVLETDYIQMMRDLMSKDHLTIDISANEIGPQLKSIHTVEKIKHAELFKLGIVHDSFYYLSISTTKDEPFTREQQASFNYRVGVLRSLINKR